MYNIETFLLAIIRLGDPDIALEVVGQPVLAAAEACGPTIYLRLPVPSPAMPAYAACK